MQQDVGFQIMLEILIEGAMQQDIGFQVMLEILVESAERMGWGEAFLKEQPHRVALVAKGGLHADKDFAELRTKEGPKWPRSRRAMAC